MQQALAQAGLAPFLAGFAVTLVLFKLRLGGLAAAAGFALTAWLIGEIQLEPLAVKRRLVLLALGAPVLGLVIDIAFRPGRTTAYLLGVFFGCASLWVFGNVLMQRPPMIAFLFGGGIVFFVAWTVAFTAGLQDDSVRAGASGLGLGLGVGTAALVLKATPFWELGLALGAASAGLLLAQALLGRRIDAGLVFCLTAGVLASLAAAAALLNSRLGWTELAILALVPLAARLPLPVLSTFACGAAAAASAYLASRGWPSWLQ